MTRPPGRAFWFCYTPPMLRSTLPLLFSSAVIAAIAGAGCGPTVDCTNLCQRTIACEVSFQPADDPTEEKVASGERTELESCAIGCEESELVTVESATCIDGLDVRDANVCQDQVLQCLGVEEEDL